MGEGGRERGGEIGGRRRRRRRKKEGEELRLSPITVREKEGRKRREERRHLVFHGCFPICCYHFFLLSPVPFGATVAVVVGGALPVHQTERERERERERRRGME